MKLTHRRILFGLCVVAGISSAAVAYAGLSSSDVVWVDQGAASGTLYDTRFSTSGGVYIGCEIDSSFDDSGQPLGVCVANDAQNELAACATRDPHMLDTIRMINTGSRIYFRVNADTTCWKINVTNASHTMN